jgi:antitoxin component YwqK of YwqJK toxin-antitoxin module
MNTDYHGFFIFVFRMIVFFVIKLYSNLVHFKWNALKRPICGLLLIACFFTPALLFGNERIIEQDSDSDGKIDRIAHFDLSGNLVFLEVDTNGSQTMDLFQYYEKGVVVRLERDTDGDGQIDEIDILEEGKRTASKRLNSRGEVVSAMKYDAQERPLQWRRDTTGDGRMDTVYNYQEGKVQLVALDTTGDGHMNVWQRFQDDKPYEQTSDVTGDDRIDQMTKYDSQGRSVESWHDFDEDGEMETRRLYQNGEICRQEHFINGKSQPDVVTDFADGRAIVEKRDSNDDGAFDVLVRMSQGKSASMEEDTNHDGRMDRFTVFDDRGRPLTMEEFTVNSSRPVRVSRFKEGKLCNIEQVDKGRKVSTMFKDDKPVTQTIDEDRDGRPEETIIYDKKGLIKSAVSDTSRDGRIDIWQYYSQGMLHRVEQDRNHDGKVDAKFQYAAGQQVQSLLDSDGDGHFETLVRFDAPKWTKVIELSDTEGHLRERIFYSTDVVRKKEIFNGVADLPVSVEEYDQAGKITLSRKSEDGSGLLNLTWHYDSEENAVMAEKDVDGDGRTDTWYYYEDGRVTKVEEDRNRDGKPDLWEAYDDAETVVYRSEDLDFDGTADIEKRF